MSEIEYIPGGLSVDDRGQLAYVNEFSLNGYNRFYLVSNHRAEFIRAWHGHKQEAKAVCVIKGSAIIAAVKVDNWENPSKNLPVHRTVMSAKKPGILKIPAGYANGFMTLEEGTIVCFYSTSSLEESANDDFRFEAHYWNPWNIEER